MIVQKIPMPPEQKTGAPVQCAAYDARKLIPDGVQTTIQLDEKTYVLRITRAGKLILTK